MRGLINQYKNLDRIAKLYLGAQFFGALYFAWPIWYGFASLRLTPFQVGIYFSVLAITSVIAELPTGVFGDKYGRKLSSLVGAAISGLSPLVLYFGHNFSTYILGAALLGIGGAFLSGSLEAMVYDHPSVSKQVYRQIVWLEIMFYQTGLISSALIGGFLYQFNHSLPFVGEALASLICVILIFQMRELRVEKQASNVESNRHFFVAGLHFLLQNTYLRVLVTTAVVLQVMFSASIEFINEASMIGYGIRPENRGLLIAGSKVVALIILNAVLLKLLHRDKAKLVFIAVMSSLIFLLMNVHVLTAFLAGFLVFNWISATQQSLLPDLSELANNVGDGGDEVFVENRGDDFFGGWIFY